MTRPLPITRILLGFALIGLVALAILAFRALKQDVEGYNEARAGNIHWHVAQTEIELSKFIAVLSRFTARDPLVTRQHLNQQFDILWRHTYDYRTGEMAERLRRYDAEIDAIPLLISRLDGLQAAILNIDPARTEENLLLVHRFGDIDAQLRRMTLNALLDDEARSAAVRASIQSSSYLTLLVWGAAVVLSGLLVGVMLVEARRYERTIRETEELAHKAEAANRAKSRFLTMMSHELRTPMNGVLGLIALAKQTGLSEPQKRLIEQAERAGRHMTGLLADILDFSDLQTERLEIDNAPFAVRDLGEAVAEAIAPAAARNGVAATVDYGDDAPDWVVGDLARLRQALTHCIAHFLEAAGTRRLRLTLAHRDGALVARVRVELATPQNAQWARETFLDRDERDNEEFSSSALGPTIARGLIALMGGSVETSLPGEGRIDLIMRTPAEAMAPRQDCVRLETTSETTRLVAEAAIDRQRWRLWSPELGDARVGAVLVEPGGVEDAQRAALFRDQHPGARLVALGQPAERGLYDAVCALPYDPNELARAMAGDLDEAESA